MSSVRKSGNGRMEKKASTHRFGPRCSRTGPSSRNDPIVDGRKSAHMSSRDTFFPKQLHTARFARQSEAIAAARRWYRTRQVRACAGRARFEFFSNGRALFRPVGTRGTRRLSAFEFSDGKRGEGRVVPRLEGFLGLGGIFVGCFWGRLRCWGLDDFLG